MYWRVRKSTLNGTITVPPSKSHTIRALLIATLADGDSVISNCLSEGDGKSALNAATGLGAICRIEDNSVFIKGTGGLITGGSDELFLGNSGTSTNLFTSVAALGSRPRRFDGDNSLRKRPVKPLLLALEKLGCNYIIHQDSQDVPFTVQGPLHGGETNVSGFNSQFLSSLLLSTPLLPDDTIIHVVNLHEKPYIEMTLWWLNKMGIKYSVSDDYSTFTVKGLQKYKPFSEHIPGDFSSATFSAVGAALTGGCITLENIDFSDPQGDKGIFEILEKMGVQVQRRKNSAVVTVNGNIYGITIDLNEMPDALPALSVLGCIAEGETKIINVKQARIKETDRISVMNNELKKMGADIQELEDGLIIRTSRLTGGEVNGHDDHRVVMSLALAGMVAEGETLIDTVESAAITYPSFYDDFLSIGADISIC